MDKEYLEILTVDDYVELKKELNKKFEENLHLLDISGYLEILEIMLKYNKNLKLSLHHFKHFINEKSSKNLDENIKKTLKVNMNASVKDDFKTIEQHDFNEKNALIFYDIIEKKITITSNFLKVLDIPEKKYTFYSLIKELYKKIDGIKPFFMKLKNEIYNDTEKIEIFYFKNGKKLEIVYKIYEFNDYRGLLFNIKILNDYYPILNYDELTGVLKRDIILKLIEDYSKDYRNKNMAVVLINLNSFRNVNNLFGFKMGDYVLKKISERIKFTIRKGDILGRISGDEFVLLLNNYNSIVNLRMIAERLLEKISEPIILLNKSYKVTASLGIAILEENKKNINHIMEYANLALEKAKIKHGNSYQFYEDIYHKEILRELKIDRELKEAIEEDQFIIYYQPLFNSQSQKITGFEALVRWKHPEKGIVSPMEFIPIAEKNGDIIPLGNLILKKAINEMKDILEAYNLKLSINFSAKQFDSPKFTHNINDIIGETRIKSKYIELEITETAVMENLDMNIQKMKELKNLGYSLAIDDFGTGYSSLSYLRKFPVNKLKIDRSFIQNLLNDEELQKIIKYIVKIAEALKLEVVMEGIEKEEEINVLKELGCTTLQGYYLCRPQPLDILKEKIKGFL
ncbi:diguanylate cyclase (GGDEF)-like protein [Hypnocyclicus thermotrophus]|uniref:Diguanylate cyclase (GGDEF)-like protein n=1 Tax=Hypnocyclicus thermotrophus TaxID=1627895 RepID=A0AA46I4Y0_9FUSO|nr:bifunctional diguanylate cyclase/phosphodiesterase [Hypnocyclicus thermotrophus]TDT67413.1 diguanylate cyclase (GGDEF)-like protein [Hypnocyclicus thermotrophus]